MFNNSKDLGLKGLSMKNDPARCRQDLMAQERRPPGWPQAPSVPGSRELSLESVPGWEHSPGECSWLRPRCWSPAAAAGWRCAPPPPRSWPFWIRQASIDSVSMLSHLFVNISSINIILRVLMRYPFSRTTARTNVQVPVDKLRTNRWWSPGPPPLRLSGYRGVQRYWPVSMCICFERELWWSHGIGVVSNNWFDCVLLSIIYMFKISCGPMFKHPSLDPLSSP